MSKLNKKIEIVETGNYLVGELSGVDFTVAGQGVDQKTNKEISWGTSIKLKFVQNQKVLKNVNGVDVATLKVVSQIVKIATTEDKLPQLVAKYNEKLGQVIMINYVPSDNASFTTLEENIHFM